MVRMSKLDGTIRKDKVEVMSQERGSLSQVSSQSQLSFLPLLLQLSQGGRDIYREDGGVGDNVAGEKCGGRREKVALLYAGSK